MDADGLAALRRVFAIAGDRNEIIRPYRKGAT
jgi:hypothetical protein